MATHNSPPRPEEHSRSNKPTSHKSKPTTISSLFLSTFTTTSSSSSSSSTKKNFTSSTFRGLVCTSSSSEVSAPVAAVRSSADWKAKIVSNKKKKKKKQRSAHRKKQGNGGVVGVPDVWCSPGIAFVAADDCVVVSRRPPVASRGRVDGERIHRERSCNARPRSNYEQISNLDSSSTYETRRFGSDVLPSRRYRHMRGLHRSPGGLAEIAMFQASLLSDETSVQDEFGDWRLDVDNMSYEELLELGDRIGHVSTGLREEEIFRCLRKMKHSNWHALPSHFSPGTEWKCSICQEEYEVNDEVGKLECGHNYHTYCIKQWLLQKNACPVCKSTAA